jgi:glycosyltransferase involved in cell wall biosynthesis
MRILHVTNAYPYPDVPEYGVFVKEQIAALNRAGIACDVHFVNARAEGKGAYLKAIRTLRAQARDYDAIHCHHLYSALVAMLARVKAPVVLSFQNDWLREVEIQNRTVQRALCRVGAHYADRVIFKSPIPPQFRGRAKFVHLPNGVNYDAFAITGQAGARARLGLDPAARYALFVSSKDRDRPQKRYDRFHQTVDLVRARRPDLDLRELVMVNQPRERVSDFFNAADLHILCSDYEGSPNSVKEALCTGLPVVATNVGNVEEMLESVPGCHVATGFDPAGIAPLVEQVLADPPARLAVRDGFVAKGLSQAAVTEKLRGLYQDVVGLAA